jgi:hypothetical protein
MIWKAPRYGDGAVGSIGIFEIEIYRPSGRQSDPGPQPYQLRVGRREFKFVQPVSDLESAKRSAESILRRCLTDAFQDLDTPAC